MPANALAPVAPHIWDLSVNPRRPEQISAEVQLRLAHESRPSAPRWLAGERIVTCAVTIVAGTEGAGKSFFAAELAAQVSREGGAAVYAHGADLAPGWLRARLDAAGAAADRVALVELARPRHAAAPPLDALLDRLVAAASVARGSHDCRMLIVDPLQTWAGETDCAASPARASFALVKLAEIARRLEIAVVVLLRLHAGRAARELHRASPLAPVVWLAAEDEDRTGPRLLINVKNNLGPQRSCAAFEIAENRIVWTPGEPLDLAAIEAFSPRSAWVSSRQERTAAIEWLLAILGQGPLPSAELFAEAAACGISPRTLRRAAKSLGLAPRKQGFAEGWVWRLPDAALPPARRRSEDGHFSLAVFDEGGHSALASSAAEAAAQIARAKASEDACSTGDLRQ